MLRHPYHLVEVSPWPFLASLSFLVFGVNFISTIQSTQTIFGTSSNTIGLIISFSCILLVLFQWWRDVLREGQAGYHTQKVQNGILIGFVLFLISEIMLFLSFFWAYFYSSLIPDVTLGGVWPPIGIHKIDAWSIPLLGSCILLGSGFILTLGHHLFLTGNKDLSLLYMAISVIVGTSFIFLQYTEYFSSAFTIADSVYGSIFYMTTGLHGLHVIAGVFFLFVSTIRVFLDSQTISHSLGLDFSIYYYHLVDVIWLLLFVIYYWYGGV